MAWGVMTKTPLFHLCRRIARARAVELDAVDHHRVQG
jgi:hypothetical protein